MSIQVRELFIYIQLLVKTGKLWQYFSITSIKTYSR